MLGAISPIAGFTGFLLTMFIVTFGISIYFIPTIVALVRRHTQWGPILIINLFFGLTIIGWVGALVWASSTFKYMKQHPAQQQRNPWYG